MTTIKKQKVKHDLVPVHEKLSEQEKEKLLSELTVTFKDLPKIYIDDPSIQDMELKPGDIIRVTRKSGTAKETNFYRGVINA